MANKKSVTSQYSLVKGALLDISVYVHTGMEIEDIEEILTKVLMESKQGYAKPLNGLLAYHIQTNYSSDKDVIKLMDKIVDELDIELAKMKYDDISKKIN